MVCVFFVFFFFFVVFFCFRFSLKNKIEVCSLRCCGPSPRGEVRGGEGSFFPQSSPHGDSPRRGTEGDTLWDQPWCSPEGFEDPVGSAQRGLGPGSHLAPLQVQGASRRRPPKPPRARSFCFRTKSGTGTGFFFFLMRSMFERKEKKKKKGKPKTTLVLL